MSTRGFSEWTLAKVAEHNARVGQPRPLPPLDTAAARIGAPTFPTRPRTRNTGRWLEEAIAAAAADYEAAHVLTIRKVEPPCKIIGTGPARKVIFLDNDWLDFAGTWTERGGRHLLIEAKSTEGERLPILQRDGGLTERQCRALRMWTDAGSVALILWGHTPTATVRAIPAAALFRAIADGRKSLRPEDGVECRKTRSFRDNFAEPLRNFYQ